mmetsp:Transcript_20653/g.42118  ORF Transcript_20653/g.42118 Transcript_20653/m.42118 type:complete len:111 (+) Transcript_20653:940-1272(+)
MIDEAKTHRKSTEQEKKVSSRMDRMQSSAMALGGGGIGGMGNGGLHKMMEAAANRMPGGVGFGALGGLGGGMGGGMGGGVCCLSSSNSCSNRLQERLVVLVTQCSPCSSR